MSIGFIIVVYKEDFHNCESYRSLLQSITNCETALNKIYIYDNTDIAGWRIESKNDDVYYHHNPLNPGLSVAYNFMAKKAKVDGMQWIVLLDQDTLLPQNIVCQYARISENNDYELIVPIVRSQNMIISPFTFYFFRPFKLKHVPAVEYNIRKYAFINTGLMIKLDFFQKVGGYNEKIKLDFTDLEFVERAKFHTQSFKVMPVECQQNFSHHSDDLTKSLKRYSIYIRDLKNCKPQDKLRNFIYKLNGTLHLLKLTYKYKTIDFFKIYFKG